jgi:hypothetical protein
MFTLVQHFSLVTLAVVVMARFAGVVLRGGVCPSCLGHGKHREDCPMNRD